MLAREEFRTYVYAAWAFTIAAATNKENAKRRERRFKPGTRDDVFQPERAVLQRILLAVRTSVASTTTASVAYSPGDQGVFIAADQREHLTGKTGSNARIFFNHRRGLGKHLKQFTSIRPTTIRLDSLLPVDQDFIRRRLGYRRNEIDWRGQISVKSLDALTWIKVTAQELPVSAAMVESALNAGASVITERLFIATERRRRVKNEEVVDNIAALPERQFASLAEDAWNALLRERNGIPVPTTIHPSGIATSSDFAIVRHTEATVSKERFLDTVRTAFLRGGLKKSLLIVIVTKSADSLDDTLADVAREVGVDVYFLIVAAEELATLVTRHSWIWTKHVGVAGIKVFDVETPSDLTTTLGPTIEDAAHAWRVVRTAVVSLRRTMRERAAALRERIATLARAELRGSPYAFHDRTKLMERDTRSAALLQRIVRPLIKTRFPLLTTEFHMAARRQIKPGTRALLTGMPGSGKSTTALLAIAQQVVPKAAAPVSVVIIQPSAEPKLVAAFVRDLGEPCAILMEDIDQHVGRPTLATLLETVLSAAPTGATIVATATRADDAFDRTYGRILHQARFDRASLDERDDHLEEAIIDDCARAAGIRLTHHRRATLRDRIALEAGTRVAAMIRWTLDVLGPSLFSDAHEDAEIDWWRARIQALPAAERELAVAIATFSWLDSRVPPIPRAWVQAFYDPRPIEPMLTAVLKTGLITRAGDILQVPRGPRRAFGDFVHLGEPYDSPYLRLAEWLLTTTLLDKAVRVRLLEQIRQPLWWPTRGKEPQPTEELRNNKRVALYDRVERKIKQLQAGKRAQPPTSGT